MKMLILEREIISRLTGENGLLSGNEGHLSHHMTKQIHVASVQSDH